jgi:type IV secretory pathway VirJ component
MRKENVKTSYLLHLSTIADYKISDQPWVNIQSAGWVNIQSAPTA